VTVKNEGSYQFFLDASMIFQLLWFFLLLNLFSCSTSYFDQINNITRAQYLSGIVEQFNPEVMDISSGFIPLNIHGNKYYFSVDTGAPFSMIKSSTIEKIKESIINEGFNSEGKYIEIDTFSIGSINAKNFIFYQSDRTGPSFISGSIGLNLLSKFFVAINTSKNELILSPSLNHEIEGTRFQEYLPGARARIKIPGRINNVTGSWIIDTGYTNHNLNVVIDRENLHNSDFLVREFLGSVNSPIIYEKLAPKRTGIARSVEIDGVKIQNFRFSILSIPDTDEGNEHKSTAFNALGLINWAFLSDSIVSLDFLHEKISIDRNKPLDIVALSRDIEAYMGVGFVPIDFSDLDIWEVSLLQKDSFLQRAGLRIGDAVFLNSGWKDFYMNKIDPFDRTGQYNSIVDGDLMQFMIVREGVKIQIHALYEKPLPPFSD